MAVVQFITQFTVATDTAERTYPAGSTLSADAPDAKLAVQSGAAVPLDDDEPEVEAPAEKRRKAPPAEGGDYFEVADKN